MISNSQNTKTDIHSFAWDVAVAILIGLGVSFILFSVIYAQDVAELLRTPEVLWNVLCGRPVEKNELTLPLLRAFGAMTLVAAMTIAWLKKTSRKTN